MYKKMMVPVDLAHLDKLNKAIETAVDLARHYGIPLSFVGVTTGTPSSVAHTPKEYSEKLQKFADAQGDQHAIAIEAVTVTSHDPAIDLSERLIEAIDETKSDLVVMASHLPGLPEHIFASHAGAVASHARVSVFVVR